MSTGTTLVEEHLQAADTLESYARHHSATRLAVADLLSQSDRLRQRAARVRERRENLNMQWNLLPVGDCEERTRWMMENELLDALTGPIPETAERCAGCLPAEGDYGEGPPPMVLGRHADGCQGGIPETAAAAAPLCTACPGPAVMKVCTNPGCPVHEESRIVGRMLRAGDKEGLATFVNRSGAARAKAAADRIKQASETAADPGAGVTAGEAKPCDCRVPGPGNGNSKCKAPMRWVCQCECHGAESGK